MNMLGVLILVALVAFLAGALAFAVSVYRLMFGAMLAGKPVLVTLPGNRPGHSVTYAVRPTGWKRLTPRAHMTRRGRKTIRRLRDVAARQAQTVGGE